MSTRMRAGVESATLLAATLGIIGLEFAAHANRPAPAGVPGHSATTQPAPEADPPRLSWVEAESGTVLFTDHDIVRFDWDRQLFQLTRERAMDLISRPPALQTDFVLRDRQGEIYRGCFMSSCSSFGYEGPTITDGLLSGIRPPLYGIDGGYPGGGGTRDAVRFDARLRRGLEGTRLLGRIEHPENVDPIEKSFIGWHGGEGGLKLAMLLFPETFRAGQDARWVLRFYRDRRVDLQAEALRAHVTLRTEDGTFVVDALENIPPDVIQRETAPFQGTFACRKPLPAVALGHGQHARGEARTAELAVTLTAGRKSEQGLIPIGTWEIPPQRIEILPAQTAAAPRQHENERKAAE